MLSKIFKWNGNNNSKRKSSRVSKQKSNESEKEKRKRAETIDEEKEKQRKLLQLKQAKQMYDIGVLINRNHEYFKILYGPITYETFYQYLHFSNAEDYIFNDIDALRECCIQSEILEYDQMDEFFCNFSQKQNDIGSGIKYSFVDVGKCILFRFIDDIHQQKWVKYKEKLKNMDCDVLIIVNSTNVPIYILYDVEIDLMAESIKFCHFDEYHSGDITKLNQRANKDTNFGLTKTFEYFQKFNFNFFHTHNFGNYHHGKKLQHAICYNFKDEASKKLFLEQRFDIGLILNAEDEIICVLRETLYGMLDKRLRYQRCQTNVEYTYSEVQKVAKETKIAKIDSFYHLENDDDKKNELFDLSAHKKCILMNLLDEHSLFLDSHQTSGVFSDYYKAANICDHHVQSPTVMSEDFDDLDEDEDEELPDTPYPSNNVKQRSNTLSTLTDGEEGGTEVLSDEHPKLESVGSGAIVAQILQRQ